MQPGAEIVMPFVMMLLVWGVGGCLGIASFAVWIWALVDCLKVPTDDDYQTGTKLIWALVILLGHGVGGLIYLFVGRPKPSANI